MAILKVLNKAGKYRDVNAREDVARYILDFSKMCNHYFGGVGVTEDIVGSMNEVAMRFGKTNGVQLRHFVLSFPPEELDDPEEVNEIACEIARFLGQEYQTIFAVHENTENLHIHFMHNSVSYRDGYKYKGNKEQYYNLVNFATKLLRHNYGIPLKTVSCKSDEDIQ